MPLDHVKKSYTAHAGEYAEYTVGGSKEEHARTWLREDTVDAWRHNRSYQTLDPLLAGYPEATWLTVGDGRYGKDAHYIQTKGFRVLATDISDHLLKEALNVGYIARYQTENAEALSFADNSFDFIFCKEAYHHFPRPMLALYEMLRVCRKGVVLIEPNDLFIASDFSGILWLSLKIILDFLSIRKMVKHGYEEIGNYVYAISPREVEKVAVALNLPTVAFKGINDQHLTGVEYDKADRKSKLFRKVRRIIGFRDFLYKIRLRPCSALVIIIFKEEPEEELRKALKLSDYQVVNLPKNPHL
jgi:ubiquinone/menaquinone biosynthesis C-methylase UbiE